MRYELMQPLVLFFKGLMARPVARDSVMLRHDFLQIKEGRIAMCDINAPLYRNCLITDSKIDISGDCYGCFSSVSFLRCQLFLTPHNMKPFTNCLFVECKMNDEPVDKDGKVITE